MSSFFWTSLLVVDFSLTMPWGGGTYYLLILSEDLKFREVRKSAPGHMGRLRRPLSSNIYRVLTLF